uniref:Cys-Gly metallodipeptidase DUG1 n=1 Tax=Lygus hesperus TaxID=30085 RepID=A0A0A9YUZ9_LYGHE
MICLDSGSMNYDQLWATTSLRGVASGVLKIHTLKESMHSGVGGGVVPDTFRVARILLDRIEDSVTGEVKIPEAHCEIPAHVLKANEVMSTIDYKGQYAFLPNVSAEATSSCELALRNCWKPSLTVVGANLPDCKIAGNVIRQETAVKLSLRTPPIVDANKACDAMHKILVANPPYGAHVEFVPDACGSGCATPELAPWLSRALEEGSKLAFNKTYGCMGMGGSIPFIGMLIQTYPKAQFVVTGVLGPKSNAHGPDEFLHIPYVKGVTLGVARVLGDHFVHTPKA